MQIYESPIYKVRLRYPAAWSKEQGYEERYGGEDGFFQVSAVGGQDTAIGDAARTEAYHQLLPYGTQPVIRHAVVQGREARVIWPSADQPSDMKGQAALIVRYPQPVKIGRHVHAFFLLWADSSHLQRIGNLLQFMV
jgi:TolB protein